MKLLDLDLLASTGTTYDQTRTTIQGRVSQRTIDLTPVLGPPPSRFIDVFTDSNQVITATFYASDNFRLFVLGAQTAGLLPIMCYEFNATTGQHTYIGRINVQMPASPTIVHTIRALKVVDSGTTGWKIYIVATGTILLAGSGTLLVNKIDRADFVQISPPQIPFATGSDQKAVYQLGRRATMKSLSIGITLGTPVKFNWPSHGFNNNDQVYFTTQVGAAWTTSTFVVNTKYFVRNASANDFELSATFNGASIAAAAGPTTVVMQELNQELDAVGAILDTGTNKLYTHVGTNALHQYFVRDTSVSPTYSTLPANVLAGTPAKIGMVGHPFVENEPIVFTTGALPTGFLLNTTYFVRNPSANDFELSATVGGASINAAAASSNAEIGRAFGYTNSQWLHKTNILPILNGTLLATDAERNATPSDAPINGPLLNGQSCAFFATATNLYLGRLDELTSETITWPSLTTSNYLGALNQIVTPVVTSASWADSIDHAIFIAGAAATNAFRVVVKKVQNNALTALFGGMCLDYLETSNRPAYKLNLAAPAVNFTNQNGWLFVAGGTVGQRGILAVDMRSDYLFDYSYIVSKVVTLPANYQIKTVKILDKLSDISGEVIVYYRTTGFGSISGNWIALNKGDDLSSLALAGTQIQFKIGFKTVSMGETAHLQISDLLVGYGAQEELSDNWEYSFDDSSSAIPTRVGFRLKQAYSSAIPSTLTFKAFDLSGAQVVSQSITSDPDRFEYKTDGGTTWLPLGTIPNVVGTVVRYTFFSPPGVDVRPTLKDS